MTFIEIFGIYVSSAGTLASILGIFFAIYAKQNGKVTREFIAHIVQQTHQETQALISKNHEQTTQLFQRMDETLKKMDERAYESEKERRAHEKFMQELQIRILEKIR